MMTLEFWTGAWAQTLQRWRDLDRPTREKAAALGACFVVFFLYAGIWAPVQRKADTLTRAVARDEARLVIMKSQFQEALTLRGSNTMKRDLASSPLTTVEQAADRRSLRPNIRNMTQDPTSGLHVSLDAAPFNLVVNWLNDLRTQSGIRVERATLQPNSTEGTIDAQLVLR